MEWERDRFTRLRLPSPDLWVCFLQVMWLQWLIYRQLILSAYMHQTKPTGMQRNSSSKGRQEDTVSQHQPSQGTTTERMSFPTRGKGKTNRKAQHHTICSPSRERQGSSNKKPLNTREQETKTSQGGQIAFFLKRTDVLTETCGNLKDCWLKSPSSDSSLCHRYNPFHLLTSAATENALVLLQTSHQGGGRLGRCLAVISTMTFH